MSLFAISDLHLSLNSNKPMDVFGIQWENHTEKIKENWNLNLSKEDTVLIPGDISWAMSLEEAFLDFEFIHNLPGTKIITKGNHDYWWSSVNKIETFFLKNGFDSIKVLKNNSFIVENKYIICGTRGWILPEDTGFTENDLKIYKREENRLRLSLESAKLNKKSNMQIIVMMHYPPLLPKFKNTSFTEILQEYDVFECLYGHVHDKVSDRCFEGVLNGIKYTNISADKIAFNPLQL